MENSPAPRAEVRRMNAQVEKTAICPKERMLEMPEGKGTRTVPFRKESVPCTNLVGNPQEACKTGLFNKAGVSFSA